MRRGRFTLLQVGIVVALVVLVAALVLVIVMYVGNAARRVDSEAVMKEVGYALQMYANDNGGQLPGVSPPAAAGTGNER